MGRTLCSRIREEAFFVQLQGVRKTSWRREIPRWALKGTAIDEIHQWLELKKYLAKEEQEGRWLHQIEISKKKKKSYLKHPSQCSDVIFLPFKGNYKRSQHLEPLHSASYSATNKINFKMVIRIGKEEAKLLSFINDMTAYTPQTIKKWIREFTMSVEYKVSVQKLVHPYSSTALRKCNVYVCTRNSVATSKTLYLVRNPVIYVWHLWSNVNT